MQPDPRPGSAARFGMPGEFKPGNARKPIVRWCRPCAASHPGAVDVRTKVRALPGRLSGRSVFRCKSVLYGGFVWARRVLNGQKRRFPARAEAVQCAAAPREAVRAVRRGRARVRAARREGRAGGERAPGGAVVRALRGGPPRRNRLADGASPLVVVVCVGGARGV
jgi:hypothetical protein